MTTTDPTAIAIAFDPLTQRMAGRAVHGNTPFDVPFVSPVAHNLWTGGCENGLVLPSDVLHLVSLYRWESYTVKHDLDSAMVVKMYDSADGLNIDQVRSIAAWVNVCRRSGVTLVHCQAGLNRSGFIAAAALVLDGMTPTEAVALLREKRSPAVLCNPTFLQQLDEVAQ